MSALEKAFWAAGWDESEHPRDPEGTATGGQFRAKSGFTVAQLEENLAMHERNLGVAQRRRPSSTAGPRGGVKEREGQVERQQARVDKARAMLDEALAERDAPAARTFEAGTKLYHSSYHGDAIVKEGFKPSRMGESGPGVYLTPTSNMFERYPERQKLEVELAEPVSVLDRTTPEGEAIYRKIQQDASVDFEDTPTGISELLKKAGYDGVYYDSFGDIELVVHNPHVLRAKLLASAWDESKHPRDPGGEGGGQWISNEDQDTSQQKAILKTNKIARKVRGMYPAGTRVEAKISGEQGTVARHVPGNNAQGGSLTVKWDNGVTGRHPPSGIKVVQDPGTPWEEQAWVDPPEPRGIHAGIGGAGGYTTDRAETTLTEMGREGEALFREIAGESELMHPPGKGEQSPLDVQVGDWGFEVKSVDADSTSFKATPKKHEMASKEAFAREHKLKPAIAIVVIDRKAGEAQAYYREGLKGGRLSENTGWKYMGKTKLAQRASAFDESKVRRQPKGVPIGGQFASVFHVSPVSNREAIREKGLVPNAEKRYTDSGEGVYVFGSRDEAWRFATTGERMYGDSDIWEAKTGELPFERDPFFEEGHPMAERAVAQFKGEKPDAFVTQATIPPESLKLHANPWHPEPPPEPYVEKPKDKAPLKLIDDLIYGKDRAYTGNPEGVKVLYMPDPRDAVATEFDLNNAPPLSRIERAKAIVEQKSQVYLHNLYPDGVVTLYRGGEGFAEKNQPLLAWTPKHQVAMRFARDDPDKVREIDVSIEDIVVALPALSIGGYDEEEYLLPPSLTGSAYEEQEHPRWPAGHPLGGQWRPKAGGAEGTEPTSLDDVVQAYISRHGHLVGKEVNITRVSLGPSLTGEITRFAPEGVVVAGYGVVPWAEIDTIGGDPLVTFDRTYELRYNEELQKLTYGEDTNIDWNVHTPERARAEREIEAQVQADENRKYRELTADQERFKVPVGQAKNFRAWMEEHYYREYASEYSYPNGHQIRITDPRLVSINENWGNWTQNEMQFLTGELNKQLNEGGGGYQMSGFLSGAYAKESGISRSRERGEAKRLIDPIDKVYYTQLLGEEEARRSYPELFETKAPKVKNVAPRDQGVPEFYLTERGTFKPGYDAKLKSDLVASAMSHYPMSIKPGTVSAETTKEAVDAWRAAYPSQTQDSNGVEYTDQQLEKIALTQTLDYPQELRSRIRSEAASRWTDDVNHRFTPEEARRILNERGWDKFLRQKEDKFKITETPPTREDIVSREIAERNWGDAMVARGHEYREVRAWVNAMAEFEPNVVSKVTTRGGTVHFGPGPSTDQDDMHSLYDEAGGGWGNTHLDKVRGFYSPSSKTVAMGTAGRGGSANVTAHEVAHMIGNVLNIDESDRLYTFHKQLYPQLDRYFRQQGRGGFRGRKELWAEGVAVVMENRSRARRGLEPTRNSGPFQYAPGGEYHQISDKEAKAQAEYYAWVDQALRRIDELPDEAFPTQRTSVAPPGWIWRKDAVLGINILEPAE